MSKLRVRQRIAVLRSAIRAINAIERSQLDSKIATDILVQRVDIVESKLDEFVEHVKVEGSREELRQLARAVEDVRAELTATISQASEREMGVLRAIYENAPGNRRRLWELRSSEAYERAYTDGSPLVSVCIPTYDNVEALVNRSLPSILNQTYENFEVIIVGDGSPPEVEEAINTLSDERIQYTNLLVRGPYPSDLDEFWMVAGAEAQREATRISRGAWVAHNSDDDAFTPDHIETLLAAARERRLEIAYGKIRKLYPNGEVDILGKFPPTLFQQGWQSALIHGGFKLFPSEPLTAWGIPGDMIWLQRMLALGVRFGMVDKVVVDYYPSLLWGTPSRPLRSTNEDEMSMFHSPTRQA
jgi:hypothetical protein